MAKKRYNKLQAENFAEKFGKTGCIEGMLYNFVDLGKAVKFFADKNDKGNLKKVFDKYFETVNSYGREELKKDSFRFLELLCYSVDGRIKIEKGKVANLYDWIMSRDGKAVKLYK